MKVYSETLVWSPPAELAALAPYQLLLVEPEAGPRLIGRAGDHHGSPPAATSNPVRRRRP